MHGIRFVTCFTAVILSFGCATQHYIVESTVKVSAPTVPDIGSVWISVTEYVTAGASRKPEILAVTRMLDGRPVVSGETFGYKGEIVEGVFGTVVYTDTCAAKVPLELLEPPVVPNQCGWHLCYPPEIGTSIARKIFIFAELYSCEPKTGIYRFSATGTAASVHGDAVVGDAVVDFGMFSKVHWQSYIKPGEGEVHGESAGRVTSYLTVNVTLKPVKPERQQSSGANRRMLKLAELFKVGSARAETAQQECRVIAYGDSLTEGLGASQDESYPAVLSKMIGFEVCNRGTSGRTSTIALEALHEVYESQPRAVIIILGANDTLRGISRQQTKNNIKAIAQNLIARGVLVVLGGVNSDSKFTTKLLEGLQQIYVDVANELGDEVLFVPGALNGVLGQAELTSSDGMHPNARGYYRLAQNLYDGAFASVLDILQGVPSLRSK